MTPEVKLVYIVMRAERGGPAVFLSAYHREAAAEAGLHAAVKKCWADQLKGGDDLPAEPPADLTDALEALGEAGIYSVWIEIIKIDDCS
jgi:hypothetical protein